MDRPPAQYWFPAKRFGWGWGPPRCWQGWAVVVVYAAVNVFGGALLLPYLGVSAELLLLAVTTAVFIAICWLTGEPPRWRWGGRD
ncbi:MAG: hypothetical protein KGI67_08030 [Pseudomonadota bacterium]|nr:hypothetical protein [Pseudomonadota bacterium]